MNTHNICFHGIMICLLSRAMKNKMRKYFKVSCADQNWHTKRLSYVSLSLIMYKWFKTV